MAWRIFLDWFVKFIIKNFTTDTDASQNKVFNNKKVISWPKIIIL